MASPPPRSLKALFGDGVEKMGFIESRAELNRVQQYTRMGGQRERGCLHFKMGPLNAGQVAQLVGASSCAPKSCGFNSQSGHITNPQLGCIWEATDQCYSYSLSPPSSFSKINKNISLGED